MQGWWCTHARTPTTSRCTERVVPLRCRYFQLYYLCFKYHFAYMAALTASRLDESFSRGASQGTLRVPGGFSTCGHRFAAWVRGNLSPQRTRRDPRGPEEPPGDQAGPRPVPAAGLGPGPGVRGRAAKWPRAGSGRGPGPGPDPSP